ncbi:inositol monophosphatase [Streptomyces sp. NPDC006552]|uniref:inositol monophosphatase family protein n=1 Tax=Streptomyces sp. NPDC006552 TaxID=3157179 RepID=UPI00339FAE33
MTDTTNFPSRQAYLTFLESLLREAAEIALSFPRGLSARIKDADPNQVVTNADLAIGTRLKSRIHERFPHDSEIDEEWGIVRGTSAITWVIDPIDGTSNFAAGSPLFGVMVGVLENGMPVAGGVSLPAFSETYVAEVGHGAYVNGNKLELKAGGDMTEQLVAYGIDFHPSETAHDYRTMENIAFRCRGIRMSNSIFDCMMVAKGVYAASMHRRNRIWDCVAPHVIIQEAGGTFSTMEGDVPDYQNPLTKTKQVYSMLACNSDFHRAVTDITRA